MLGIILRELKKYVEARLGKPLWHDVLRSAGLEDRVYLPLKNYPDEELMRIVAETSAKSGTPVPAILEDFGEFMVPDLIQIYSSIINPSWTTLDLIEHTESVIHRAVRLRALRAPTSAIEVARNGSELEIVYSSPPKLCHLAKGVVRGVARHYDERIELAEPSCMHEGSAACSIRVTKVT